MYLIMNENEDLIRQLDRAIILALLLMIFIVVSCFVFLVYRFLQ